MNDDSVCPNSQECAKTIVAQVAHLAQHFGDVMGNVALGHCRERMASIAIGALAGIAGTAEVVVQTYMDGQTIDGDFPDISAMIHLTSMRICLMGEGGDCSEVPALALEDFRRLFGRDPEGWTKPIILPWFRAVGSPCN